MRQRMELIQQIRAMEAVPVIKKKLVNLTETAGYGLLSEMSIAEVRTDFCSCIPKISVQSKIKICVLEHKIDTCNG